MELIEQIREKCTKWGDCPNEANYSFGWIDTDGEWKDKHLTCSKHAPLSALTQQQAVNMAQFRDRMRLFGQRPFIQFGGITS